MARFIFEAQLVPDIVVSSTANRAKSTAQLFVSNCDSLDCEVITTDEFYHAPAQVYLDFAAEFSDEVNTAMVVGHNPGMENLVELLSGEYERMPTAAIAHAVFDIDSWGDLKVEQCNVQSVWRPKEI